MTQNRPLFAIRLSLLFCCFVAVAFFVVMIVLGLAVDNVFAAGIRKTAVYSIRDDLASKLNEGEVCDLEHSNAFLFHLSNWNDIRNGASIRPIFEEIGPFNFTREVCIFDREIVQGSSPSTVQFRKYHKEWSLTSEPFDGSPGVDVNKEYHFINPAYFSVMQTLIRDNPSLKNGIDAEVNFHASIVSGVLKALMDGIQADDPAGFLASAYIGSIPTVLTGVIDKLNETLSAAQESAVGGVVKTLLSPDKQSKLVAATYLWARPAECNDWSKRTLGCTALKAVAFAYSTGLDVRQDGSEYQGFELGTHFGQRNSITKSDLTPEIAFQLWDEKNDDSIRTLNGIGRWNRSIADATEAKILQTQFGLSDSQMQMMLHWVGNMKTSLTPGLVVKKIIGEEYTAADVNMLTWKQLGEGSISSQRGFREDGLPKTLHDVNPKVPFAFEMSHFARLNNVDLPILGPFHLEWLFTGSTKHTSFSKMANPKPLFEATHMEEFLALSKQLVENNDLSAGDSILNIWQVNRDKAAILFNYFTWLMTSLMNATGPVVKTTARDILLEREDPLLKILVSAGRLDSAKSGVFFSALEFNTKAEAAFADLELPQRVWFGDDEKSGLQVVDEVPQGYLDSLKKERYATFDEKGKAVLLGPELNVWAEPTTVEGYSGERFHMPIKETDILKVWNDNIARPITFKKVGEDSLEGIDVWVFELEEQNWEKNALYYQNLKGLFNISHLAKADVFISGPRFVGVDGGVLSSISVLPQAQSLSCCQKWRIWVQPKSGVAMGKEISAQINFRSPGFGAFEGFSLPEGIMPLVWTEDRVVIGAEDAATFKAGLGLSNSIRLFAFIGGPLLFLSCLICIVGGALFSKKSESKEFNEMEGRQF